MPPRLPREAIGRSASLRLPLPPQTRQICPICSISRTSWPQFKRPRPSPIPQNRITVRRQSNVPSASAIDTLPKPSPKAARAALRDALLDLQKNAGSYVNISRLQLALRGLEQEAGDETIRIAILGIADSGSSLKKAKDLLRLLIADPLKTEEEWERILAQDLPGNKPLLLKVGHNGAEENGYGNRLVTELHVSSAVLNGHKLEILVLEMDPPKVGAEGVFEEAVLVPTMEIPTSSTGRYTPVTTPVHKSLIVADGVLGAAAVLNYPLDTDRSVISTAVDLQVGTEQEKAGLPFQALDVVLAEKALGSFRQSIDNALFYEENWFKSGLPEILDWVRNGTASTDGTMKQPLRKLIESMLRNASVAIEAERSRQLSAALAAMVSSSDLAALRQELSQWAERAHTELRDQLDVAFNGRRWRKLGWWKLFWRVDDVSMIASDILNQRFLTDAEKEVIFLAGQIDKAGVIKEDLQETPKNWAYKREAEKITTPTLGSEPAPPVIQDLIESPRDHLPVKIKPHPWPLHIPATRAYLSQETVPALQALAQKLVLQTLSSSGFFTAFGGLVYLSSVSNTLYEAGAVTALGIVFSLRRMQGKWENARKFWEGEVREEGRKAVRGVEGVVNDVLETPDQPLERDVELDKVREAVEKAEAALADNK
ncbi:uncharacterized protein PAC_19573 [Phialocephala subalpina]|uniref:Mmc1 C-terminal domain-containing protein n=1 Tax=Phialocephala subalpina TaxID=576137 RepID=A0A1L7XX95_9HELO|nr:uncharacterized protein PAC_19573 [Phialocephala subalpina]